jgi:hypothetical protein
MFAIASQSLFAHHAPRSFVHIPLSPQVLLALSVAATAWILLLKDGSPISETPPRRKVVFAYGLLFIARITIQMFCFWHRRIGWVEVFAEAGGVIPLTMISFAIGAASTQSDAEPLGLIDAVGCVAFLVRYEGFLLPMCLSCASRFSDRPTRRGEFAATFMVDLVRTQLSNAQ